MSIWLLEIACHIRNIVHLPSLLGGDSVGRPPRCMPLQLTWTPKDRVNVNLRLAFITIEGMVPIFWEYVSESAFATRIQSLRLFQNYVEYRFSTYLQQIGICGLRHEQRRNTPWATVSHSWEYGCPSFEFHLVPIFFSSKLASTAMLTRSINLNHRLQVNHLE